MLPYALTIFISAFLLFQIQPIIAKYILPWFGGTPAVWSTCMLFFQCLLLAGYAYAHWLSSKVSTEKRMKVHPALIVISVFLLIIAAFRWRAPILPGTDWMMRDSEFPILNIVAILGISVGLPFFVLSTTGPLVQKWFSMQYPGKSPYWLYSLSNIGSLLGLILYPFFIEPVLRLGVQAWLWSSLFIIYGFLCASLAYRQTCVVAAVGNNKVQPVDASESLLAGNMEITTGEIAIEPAADPPAIEPVKPRISDRIAWILLPAAASLMLLAVTNQMCQEVAVFPFLWIIPLSIYLLSFIFSFGHARWYPGWLAAAFFPACLVMAFLVLVMSDMNLRWQVAAYSICLFIICMGCHGELVRLKPDPKFLTAFYLCISIGGAIGGIFVAIFAPMVFNGFYELYVGLAFSFLLMFYVVFLKRRSLTGRYFSVAPGMLFFISLMALAIAVSSDWEIIKIVFKKRFTSAKVPDVSDIESIKWTWLYGIGFSGMGLAIFYWIFRPAIRRMGNLIKSPPPELTVVSRQIMLSVLVVVGVLPYFASVGIGWISLKEIYDKYKKEIKTFKSEWLYSSRNFFGVLHISTKTTINSGFSFPDFAGTGFSDETGIFPEVVDWYKLIHGTIIHGMQATDPEIRKIPSTYYSYKSGVGLILLNHPKLTDEGDNHLRVGAIGLGTGTLASYFKEGDYICFYDINPKVPEIAWGEGGYFHYLQDAKERGAKIDIVLGDGRLSMERQLKEKGSMNYDVIVLDAFSSDAIPVHLLTKEAFEIYLKHITKQGVLAVHVSNRYLDLDPVVWKIAEQFGLEAILVSSRGNDDEGIFSASWVLLTYDKDIFKNEKISEFAKTMPENLSKYSLWTDDYSNLFMYLRKDED